ncbi:MAG: TetR/AcrR family transcriptional regulator [Eubacteriales bacterium]
MKSSTTLDKKARTKKAILDAAEEAFIQNGYLNTDMGQVAQMVGIDKRTIYRYFSSKEALAFAIWQDVLTYIMDFAEDIQGDTGYEKLENMLYEYMKQVRLQKNIVRFLGEFDNTFGGEYPHIQEADEFVSYISNRENGITLCIKEGVADGSIKPDVDIYLISNTITNVVLALSERIVIRGEHLKMESGYSYEMLESCVALLLDGIKA